MGVIMVANVGCVSCTRHAIPAYRLPTQFEAPSRCNLSPINFAVLGKESSADHTLGTGDVLALIVQGIIPPSAEELPPIIQGQSTLIREYYPPNGSLLGPAVGLPVAVDMEGKLVLPLVKPVHVEGQTLLQAAESIRKAYVEEKLVIEGKDRVNLTLVKSRVNRVLVLREDASLEAAQLMPRSSSVLHKRGSGMAVDLPVSESDVLHALIASGGLPGLDANNEVWILRKTMNAAETLNQIHARSEAGDAPAEIMAGVSAHLQAIRIPLKLCPNEPIPFATEDVMLRDGDVVYVEPRRNEYFYTGGLLPGAQIPFPRDEDLDIIEAIALANGSVGGFGGASSAVFRAGAGPGNIIPPRRVLLLRKLPSGGQLPIRVDLARAMQNPAERIRIMPGDYIMMYYTPAEMTGNVALNILNFNYVVR